MPIPAIVWGSIIASGAGLGAAALNAKSSNKATDAQVDAADDALKVEQEQYDLERSDTGPWRNTGAWSMTELGRLAGMPAGWALPDTRPPQTTGQQEQAAVTDLQAVGNEAADQTEGNIFTKRRAAREAMAQAPAVQTLRDLEQQGARQQTRSSFVRIEAPDGEQRDVTPDEADFLVSRGARRI